MLFRLSISIALIIVLCWVVLVALADATGGTVPSREIAYTSYPASLAATDIYLIDFHRGIRHNLTRTPDDYEGAPAWSPDGEWIAFQSDRDGGLRIYLMDKNGGGVRMVTPQTGTFPRWTRDGGSLIFSPDPRSLALVVVATGELRQLAGPDSPASGQVIELDLAVQPGSMGSTSAPDNSRILFMRHNGQAWGLYTAPDRTRAGAIQLAVLGRSYYEAPVWSPDSRQVAFVRLNGNNYDIFVIDVLPDGSGGLLRRLTTSPAVDSAPSWRP